MTNQSSVVVLLSGRGSNFKSLLERAHSYKVIYTISDNPSAYGLEIARNNGVLSEAFDITNFKNRKELRSAIFSRVYELKPDFVCLAGFMQIVDKDHVTKLFGKLINIHPSLLPKLPGLDTHKRAIESHEKTHGCSVHFVDAGVDTGPLITQAKCPVLPLDSPETLANRVLSYEHIVYPWVLNLLSSGDITIKDGKISYSGRAVKEAQENGFTLFL